MVKVRVLKNVVASSVSLTKGDTSEISTEDARILIGQGAVKKITNADDTTFDAPNIDGMNIRQLEEFAKEQEIELPDGNKSEKLAAIKSALSDEG
jgi:hypothetical protein